MAEKLDPKLNEAYAEAMYTIQSNAIKTLPSYANGLKKIIRAFISKKEGKKEYSIKNVGVREFLKAGDQLLEILPAFNKNLTRDTSNDANSVDGIKEELKKYGVSFDSSPEEK